jgi:hypothetical protein
VLWTIIGLVLTGLGVVGLLVNLGRMPGIDRNQAVIWPDLLRLWRDWRGWILAGVIVLGLLMALLGLLLLRGQLRPRGVSMPDLQMTAPSGQGRTVVGTPVMVRGLANDLENEPGVRRAAAYLGGESDDPRLRLWLTLEPGTSLDRIRQGVHSAVDRFAATTSLRPADVTIDTRIAAGLQRSRLTPIR